MEPRWTITKSGYVKVNVHGCYSSNAMRNGNKTGVEVVLRDDKGRIINMLSGTQPGLTKGRNELFAILVGLRMAFEQKKDFVLLETDNWHAYEGYHGKFSEECQYELNQLKTRTSNPNMHVEVTYIHQAANKLATYLDQNGGETKEDLFQTSEPFGRVLEICHEDMGLGPVGVKFRREKETVVGAWAASTFASPRVTGDVQMEEGEASRAF
ncbi:hypothetical protein POM88_017448 [Heracleum sosnowskyi]|uniref:RNase H type-1 domain-containing protein n=1 Tax=Heracleum sosnowskyi TaxID=360622 RepID=A0AAD8IP90_9APIA|nr:hypothetical protein POM88_017448 [Heracleum sosnowskyi]